MPVQIAATIFQTHSNHFFTWCNMFLSGLHHSPVVRFPLFIPSNSSMLLLHLPSHFSSPLHVQEIGWFIIRLFNQVETEIYLHYNITTNYKDNSTIIWYNNTSLYKTSFNFVRQKQRKHLTGDRSGLEIDKDLYHQQRQVIQNHSVLHYFTWIYW